MNIVGLENIDDDLKELESIKPYESRENTHSKVIAYLLKTNSEFLSKMVECAGISNSKNLNLENTYIGTEVDNRKDIEIKNDDFVIVIENKYKDRNRKKVGKIDQLIVYEDYINTKYPTLEKRYIYLRPFQHELGEECKNWKTMTYQDLLNLLYLLNNKDEYIERYKKIIEKIYEPQTICILALKDVFNIDDEVIDIDNVRGDINGYSIRIRLGDEYGSFLEVEHDNPVEKKGTISICLTVKDEDKTYKDNELFEILKNCKKLTYANKNNYEYASEKICNMNKYSPEYIKEKIENSKIVSVLAQKKIFLVFPFL